MTLHELPYRLAAGIMLFNPLGLVWIGQRCGETVADEIRFRWQMPQGGIDPGENPRAAAMRELQEETGATSAEIVGETRDWLTYDLPSSVIGVALKGKYRGQRMKWYAMRFTGDDSEFDITRINHETPEFDKWRWAELDELPGLIVPFKRPVYEMVIAELRPFVKPLQR